jgi:hypothetical protein
MIFFSPSKQIPAHEFISGHWNFLPRIIRVKVHPTTAYQGQDGRRGITPIFFNIGARLGLVNNDTLRSLYPLERDPVPAAQEAGWAPGPFWMG